MTEQQRAPRLGSTEQVVQTVVKMMEIANRLGGEDGAHIGLGAGYLMGLQSQADPEGVCMALFAQRKEQKAREVDVHKQKRMSQDAAMVSDPSRWPVNGILHMKTPWWVEGVERRFGFIEAGDLLTVIDKDVFDRTETFASVEELVEKWSVD